MAYSNGLKVLIMNEQEAKKEVRGEKETKVKKIKDKGGHSKFLFDITFNSKWMERSEQEKETDRGWEFMMIIWWEWESERARELENRQRQWQSHQMS